ncbi:hypothetical protein [Streptomyces sp. NPDC000618]|uniref:hypothetical protein n=1 Tax=Streptomyces sp. NPDC000618 TaxID=3154265 RepID=UPI003318743E
MKDIAEIGIIWASRTGSTNHDEIVVPVDLDAEVGRKRRAGLRRRFLTHNHDEIVIVG